MKDQDFQQLLESVKQMGAILKNPHTPHRRTSLQPVNVKELRNKTGLTQMDFSHLLGVSIRTLQNWEQGRRKPDGPAKALLRAVQNNPSAVLTALRG